MAIRHKRRLSCQARPDLTVANQPNPTIELNYLNASYQELQCVGHRRNEHYSCSSYFSVATDADLNVDPFYDMFELEFINTTIDSNAYKNFELRPLKNIELPEQQIDETAN